MFRAATGMMDLLILNACWNPIDICKQNKIRFH